MVWIVALGTIQLAGLLISLARLAYDEWQQWRMAGNSKAEIENCHPKGA